MSFMGRRGFLVQSSVESLLSGGTIAGNLTVDGTLTMGAGRQVRLDPGTLATPGLAFTDATTSGLYRTASGPSLGNAGTAIARASASTLDVINDLTVTGRTTINSGLRVDGESTKTISYTATNTDVFVVMNGVTLTLTLPATPGPEQLLWVKNIAATTVTVARNGSTIDGAAADYSLLTTTAVLMYYDGAGWFVL